MAKLLLLTSLVSCVFLLTQLITYYDFEDLNPITRTLSQEVLSVDQDLLDAVKAFVQICKRLELSCLLAHQDLLKQFIKQEKAHRTSGRHNHQNCSLFCNQRYVTFRLNGNEVINKMDPFMEQSTSSGFTVVEDEGHDERDLSVERRKSKNTLMYHIYMERKNTMIHIVLAYPRMKHDWTNICNLELTRDSYFQSYLQKSPFCIHQTLTEPAETTAAIIDGLDITVPEYIVSYTESVIDGAFIPCNYGNARNFFSTYGVDTSSESNLFREKAVKILTIAVKVLKKLNIRFWLSSGTCLGWFRQCDFIPHSKDVDIGIWIKDYKHGLVQGFKDAGLKLKHRFGRVEDSFELSFTLDDLKLDIFFFYEEPNGMMWNGGTQARTGLKFKYLFPKFSLCWSVIADLVVRLPCPTKPYILANYGKNWNLLVKTWNWKASPPNARKNGQWPVEERDEVIQVY